MCSCAWWFSYHEVDFSGELHKCEKTNTTTIKNRVNILRPLGSRSPIFAHPAPPIRSTPLRIPPTPDTTLVPHLGKNTNDKVTHAMQDKQRERTAVLSPKSSFVCLHPYQTRQKPRTSQTRE